MFVEQLEIENLVFHEFIYRNPLCDYIMITTLYSGWNAVFGTVTESVGIFLEVLFYNIYFQNICYEHKILRTAEGMILIQEL